MKITTDIQEANVLLQHYVGAKLQIEMYSASLKRIVLKLILPNVEEVLYVVGIGCESLNGRFSFKDANLNISEEVRNNEAVWVIADRSSHFLLITSGGFSLAQGGESEFGKSFDNFLLDKR